ncbi:hypothetical protein H2248_003316 [Termitomyces sp. 'cryptogamus']|nr:hypothetical protein H2248_003316 [Termitomyces sp. 'cryptogamus']
MDSTLTLVNPSLSRLDFSKNSMLNAILKERGRPVYSISTVDNAGSRTDIKDARTKRVLATIKRRSFLSDTVTFTDHYGGERLKLDKWLKPVQLADGSDATMIETSRGAFFWKLHPIHRLALFSESDLVKPLAYAEIVVGQTMSLVLDSVTVGFQEQIIASFIILEQKFRMEEKWSSVGDGILRGEAAAFAF